MAMLTIPFLLCAVFVLSGAVAVHKSSTEAPQQDLPLGLNNEDGNPPSLISGEEEQMSDPKAEQEADQEAEQGADQEAEQGADQEAEQGADQEADQEAEQGLEVELAQGKCCPAGWSSYLARCFLFVASSKQWYDAERHCLRMGANLASVHSNGEHLFIQDLIKSKSGRYPWTWLGGTDAVKNRGWLWSDGTPFNYAVWARGEPNNHRRREPCIHTNFGSKREWNDLYCTLRYPFVCSRKL